MIIGRDVELETGDDRSLTSESTPVDRGHDFATSTGTLDREMS